MAEFSPVGPQYVGKADARLMRVAEAPKSKEAAMSPEQQQFFDRYQSELKHAKDAEQTANQRARDRLKGLSAPELRRAGLKQALWGAGLYLLDGLGAGVGGLGTYAIGGVLLAGAAVAAPGIATAMAVAGGVALAASIPMAIAGHIGGAELGGYIYNKFIRPRDAELKSLPTMDKTDWVLGGVLITPPFVAGLRNIFEGFNQFDAHKE